MSQAAEILAAIAPDAQVCTGAYYPDKKQERAIHDAIPVGTIAHTGKTSLTYALPDGSRLVRTAPRWDALPAPAACRLEDKS